MQPQPNKIGMTAEQKAEALAALDGLKVEFVSRRAPSLGPWFCGQNVQIKSGGLLKGGSGNGWTPYEAIEDQWKRFVTDLKDNEYLVIDSIKGDERRRVRWNGFMWKDWEPQ